MKPCKPMMRWWLPAAIVEYDEIDKELREAKEGGFGGLEICVNMADCAPTEKELRDFGWATENWNKLYKHILKTANALGLQIDTTLSPAWPPAVTGITPEDRAASKELSICATEPFTGTYRGSLPTETCSTTDGFQDPAGDGPPPMPPGMETPVALPNRPELVSVVAAKVLGKQDVTKDQCVNWGDMPMLWRTRTRTTVMLDGGSFRQLDVIDGKVDFTPPDGEKWMIFTAWMRGTEQQNKQGRATTDPCLVIDHFGPAGAEALIEFWETHLLDGETKALLRENGGSLFEDSMEVSVSEGCIPWSADLPERFLRERGFDIRLYFPLLHGISCGGMSNTDFYTFECANKNGGVDHMGDQIRRDYKQIITDGFAYEHIAKIQDWAKGLGLGFRCQCYSGIHDTSLCSAVCVGPEGESLGFGPDVQGDDRFRLVSGGAHMGLKTRITDEVGALANKGYRLPWKEMLRWIHKNFCGGANQMIFHGYPYAETNVSQWPGYSPFGFGLGGYWGSRNPDWRHIQEFTAYLTDMQTRLNTGRPQVDFAVLSHKYGTLAPVLKDQTLARRGYTYDIITPNVLALPTATLSNGRLCDEGPGYRAVVVNQESVLPTETLCKLSACCDSGIPVIFVGQYPEGPAFFTEDEKQWAGAMETLREKARFVAAEKDLLPALEQAGIAPLFRQEVPVAVIHRAVDGKDAYFLWNYGENPETVTLDLPAGEQTITLPAGAFRVVEPKTKESESGGGISLDHWRLTIHRYENAKDPAHSSATKYTRVDVGSVAPGYWSEIENLPPEISGFGVYETEFDWRGDSRAILRLEDASYSGVRVLLNGEPVPYDWYADEAFLSGLLSGKNHLTIELSSTLGNQLIHDGSIAAPAWMPEAKPIPDQFGFQTAVIYEM